MTRAIGLLAILLCACANGHHSGAGGDSAVADSNGSGSIDSPQSAIDSPPGTIDSKPMFDSPPGTPDSKPPDAQADANNCTTQPCTLAPQCGCDTTMMETCDIDPSTLMGNICRHVNTPGRDTNTCASFGDCDVGYVCLGDGACHHYCSQNSDCGSPRGQCVIQVVDGSTPPKDIPGAVVCSSNCDPLGNAATYCPPNDKCGIFTATFMTVAHDITDCEAQGAGGQGSNCMVGANGDDTKCMANYTCTTVNTGTSFECRRYCNKTTPGTTCSSIGKTCIGFTPALVVGGTTYGVCN